MFVKNKKEMIELRIRVLKKATKYKCPECKLRENYSNSNEVNNLLTTILMTKTDKLHEREREKRTSFTKYIGCV